MNPRLLRYHILLYLRLRERDTNQLAELEEIASSVGKPPQEVSDQIDILDSLGAIRANRAISGAASPMLTGSGKLLLEELEEEFENVGLPSRPLDVSPQGFQAYVATGSDFQWDVFISYASEDKAFVERLAEALSLKIRVWFDDFELRVGDSLRQAIDEGLKSSRFGVVIFSDHFFQKRWPQRELDGLTANERNGRKVILPVWLDIDHDGVAGYSPTSAELYAAQASDGLESVVNKLLQVILADARDSVEIPSGVRRTGEPAPPETAIEITANGYKSRPPGMDVVIILRHVYGPPVIPQSLILHSKLITGGYNRFVQAYLGPGETIEARVEVETGSEFPPQDHAWKFEQAPDDLWVIFRFRSLDGRETEVARTFGLTNPPNQNLFDVSRPTSPVINAM